MANIKIYKNSDVVILDARTDLKMFRSWRAVTYSIVNDKFTFFNGETGEQFAVNVEFLYSNIKDSAGAAAGANIDAVISYLSSQTVFLDGSGITQYVNGTAVVSPKGIVSLGYDGANLRALKTDNTGVLETNATATVEFNQEDTSYPVDGTVVGTANANIDIYGNLRVRGEALTDENSPRDDFSGTSLGALWTQSTVGGASITVLNSNVTLASSTANANSATISTSIDYCPITLRGNLSISQRLATQTAIFGLTYRVAGVIEQGAYFLFEGTDSTKISCVTQYSSNATDIEKTANARLLEGTTSAQKLYYRIDVSNNLVSFMVRTSSTSSYYILAQHELHIPGPYQALDIELSIQNTALSTNTNLVCDLVFANNMNRLQIDHDFVAEAMPVQVNLSKSDYFQSAAKGEIEGVQGRIVQGVNAAIGAGVTADIWAQGGNFTQLSTAVQHNIASTSILDTAAGTGARTVKITGLDANYNTQNETITLNGLLSVLTTKSYLFISSLEVLTTGTLLANQGAITATSSLPLVAVQATIPIGANISNAAIFLVPAGYTMFLHTALMSFSNTNNNAGVTMILTSKEFNLPTKIIEQTPLFGSSNSVSNQEYKVPYKFPEKTLVKWRCTASTNNTGANVKMAFTLIQNPV